MTHQNTKIGSLWRRWDLHLHTPGTKLSDSFGGSSDEIWEQYIDGLESSPVHAFGITDYFCCRNYFILIEKYRKKYPETQKVFFPNIEFRLSDAISKNADSPHLHIIFDNDEEQCSRDKLSKFLTTLRTHGTDEHEAGISCGELKTEAEFESATVAFKDVLTALKETFGKTTPFLLVFPAKNDGIRSTDSRSPRKVLISDNIDKRCHAFFGDANSRDYFLSTDRYDSGESVPKPVYSGSDAHSIDDLNRLTGDEPNYEPTWIKAELTFRGLQQTLFEPETRVHIGETPPVLVRKKQEATKFISKLNIDQIEGYDGENGAWFSKVEIPINAELTAIIGNKGSGKSAIADIIGLLGESKQTGHFSFLTNSKENRKFKQRGYAENFDATLTWASGATVKKNLNDDADVHKPEAIKYLPQNFFEKLTNDIEIKAFQAQIEEVVFSHVKQSERMGKSNFKDLEEFKTLQSKTNINSLMSQLDALNGEIVKLEQQANKSHKKSLEEQLRSKKDELKALEAARPGEVAKPEGETEEQKELSKKIATATETLEKLRKKERETVELLSHSKTSFQKLTTLEERMVALDTHIKKEKEELREDCAELSVDIDTVVTHNIDRSSITEKTKEVQAEIEGLEKNNNIADGDGTDFEGLSSIPDLRRARELVGQKIKELQEKLSAPNRRYQKYLTAVREYESQKSKLLGDEKDPQPDTVNFLERALSYIDTKLKGQIAQTLQQRKGLSEKIFESKKSVLNFYEELKSSVENKLNDVSAEDFTVTIEASFVAKHSFDAEFLHFVNQRVLGPFKGTEDGKKALNSMLSAVDWNDIESVHDFAVLVINEMNNGDGIEIEKQVSSIKRFYNFLFSFDYIETKYELQLGGKNLSELSPGEKGLLLLVFYLQLDKEKTPLIIDQPEDNLDNDSIFAVLAKCIRQAKKSRQVILVTHNPNLAVGADAEQILYVELEKHNNYKFNYESGAIENPRINDKIVQVLEGSKPAFVQRRLVYQI